MKLTRARVTDYKSIDDSGWVNIENVTCMLGKNESGKTAFLSALKKLNPVSGVSEGFDLKDYPRKGYVRYKRVHNENPSVVIRVEFELTEGEVKEIEADMGPGVLKTNIVVVEKDYQNRRRWVMDINEQAAVQNACDRANLPVEIRERTRKATTFAQLVSILEALDIKPSVVENLLIDIATRYKTPMRDQVATYLEKHLPVFVYFDDYSTLRGRISIPDIRRRAEAGNQLDDADRTFLSLISLVGADLEDLEAETNYEHLKAELESASINISDDVFKYWQQNRELRVEFDLSQANPNDLPPLNEGTIMHIRIWNNKHRVSVPFDERSKGFVWFFSFLAYFSGLEASGEKHNMILLFDEPGLNLHAMAQYDFLRFINERLSPKYQVVYSTHSPFMIELDKLAAVRTVQDMGDRGTIITDDPGSHDKETVFPLQVALGFGLAQSLFMAPNCLLVNSPSDMLYLQVLSEITSSRGRARLDPRWVVIPVGGADNLPMYLSLLGDNYMNVAVLMDVTAKSKRRIDTSNSGAIRNGIKVVEITKVREADMEDVFEPSFYLKLVNESYGKDLRHELTMKTINDASPRIVQRLTNYFRNEAIAGGKFETYRPASLLLQKHVEMRKDIDDSTVERASSLFERINAVLPNSAPAAAPAAAAPASSAAHHTWYTNGERARTPAGQQ